LRRDTSSRIRRLRLDSFFTIAEIASTLRVSRRTVQIWHKKEGLTPVNEGDKPMYFLGSTIQDFLRKRRDKDRRTLVDGEFYCLPCRQPRQPVPGTRTATLTGNRVGRDAQQIRISGICPVCGRTMNLLTTDQAQKRQEMKAKLTRQEQVLKGEQLRLVFGDITG